MHVIKSQLDYIILHNLSPLHIFHSFLKSRYTTRNQYGVEEKVYWRPKVIEKYNAINNVNKWRKLNQ